LLKWWFINQTHPNKPQFKLINAISLWYAFKGPIRHPLIHPHLIYNIQVLFICKIVTICQDPNGVAAICLQSPTHLYGMHRDTFTFLSVLCLTYQTDILLSLTTCLMATFGVSSLNSRKSLWYLQASMLLSDCWLWISDSCGRGATFS
jgi:hypothetical protein